MSSEHRFRGNCYRHYNVIFVTFNQTTGRVVLISPSIGTIPPACANDTSIQDLTVCLLKDGYTIQAFYQETFVFSKCKSYHDTK